MKAKYLLYAAIAATAVAFTACDNNDDDNNNSTPKEHPVLGMVGFATDSTWVVGSQEWSDAVQATGCNKTDFIGYDSITKEYCADCLSNPNVKGNQFTWQAVVDYREQLCPDGWRVPTVSDFRTLNLALGGQEVSKGESFFAPDIAEKYLSLWGGTLNFDGVSGLDTVSCSMYWSRSEFDVPLGYMLNFCYPNGFISPQNGLPKNYPLTLRCVRDV